jgi:outer membrane protein OmpA-like peptidoglycan-associated protein
MHRSRSLCPRELVLILGLTVALVVRSATGVAVPEAAPGPAAPVGAAAASASPAPATPVPRAVRRELDRAEAQLRRSLTPLIAADEGVSIAREPERVLLRLPAVLLFELDSATLKGDRAATAPLKAVSQLLKRRHQLQAQVMVYSDGAGAPSVNLAFTQQRAHALLEALSAAGVPAERVSAQGAGAATPLAANDSPEGRMMNRRVEIAFERIAPKAAGLRRVPAAASAGG